MKKLPYRATTRTGDVFDIEFPLHGETDSPMRVNQVLSAVLAVIDRDVALSGETANGDVLQALAMALAVRARIIHAPPETTARLASTLTTSALSAAIEAERRSPQTGTA